MSEIVLSTHNLVKKIGSRVIIDHLSIDVCRGEIYGFLGPNGAGKTTTIKMITGLSKITAGGICVCGKNIHSDYEAYMRNIGAIIEEPQLYKYMSGLDNLKYYAGMYQGIGQKRIDEVVRIIGMENRIKDKVKTYSLGMRQRLGLAQALLHNPALLVLDEPTNGLDPAGIKEIRDFLKYISHEFGTTVFVSSHQLSEMQLMCDRVAVIQRGKLLDVRRVDELTQGEGRLHEVVFTVDQAPQAAAFLKDAMGLECRVLGQETFEAALSRERTPEAIARLSENHFAVYGVQQGEQKSLEDIFIQMTGGGNSIG